MNDTSLNDIVIEDNDNSKKAQLKNILTLLALLFIILVISIVITRLILGGDEDSGLASGIVEGNRTDIMAQGGDSKSDSSAMGTTAAVATAALATGAAATLATRGNKDGVSNEPRRTIAERNSSSRRRPSLRDHQTATATTASTKKVTETPVKKTVVKRAFVPPKSPVKRVVSSRGYYIQVGVFKDPTNAIKKIQASNLKYKKENIKNGNLTRVLVGPYYSRGDAQNDLDKVKPIASNAYIKKVQ